MRDEPVDLSRGDLAPAAPDPAIGLAAMAAEDAGFDRNVFLDQARAAFLAVKGAIQAGDLGPVSGRLGDGVRSTLQAQLQQLAAQRAVHVFENLSIDGMAISAAIHGNEFDSIAVRIDARAAEYAIDDRRQVLFGSRTIQPFTEYWTFSRAAGVATGGAAAPPACPNCGAPIAVDSGPNCRYCGAALPPRVQVDWAVTAIQDPIDFLG